MIIMHNCINWWKIHSWQINYPRNRAFYFNVQGFWSVFTLIKCSCTLDPKLPKLHSVTITSGFVGTSPNADPSLEVSWSAVDDPAVSYVVRYSMSQGTLTSPPDGASAMGANDNSVTLSDNLASNKAHSYIYYIWVAAQSAGDTGKYSDRTRRATLTSKLSLIN